jgi:YVTN family beta-propeller protein
VANDPATGSVSVIRTSDNTVIATIPGFFAPQGLTVTPNGSFVYVANSNSSTNTVSVIQTSNNTILTTISDPSFNEPEGVAVTPDGTKVYVANFADNALSTISVIDTATNTVTTTVAVGGGPEAFGNFIGPPTLTVSETGTGTGQVTSSPVGINCSPTSTQCALGFAGGTHVTLTATANAGSMFSSWGGGCSGTGPCVIDLTNDTAVSATFTLIPSSFPLTVTDAGSGSGTVASNPSGISCGAACSANFASGTPVVLTATPAPGSTFSGWSGAGCPATGTCTVTMSAAESVTATFSPIPPVTLTVAEAGTGAGLVTSNPLGINCSASSNQCAAQFAVGTKVTLTASASGQSTFAGWSGGGCGGTGSCVVTLGANTTVTATFNPPVTLTAAEAGTGAGQVTSSPAGINCSATSNQCAAQFAAGTQVTLTASASSGSSFTGWSGGVCSGAGTCQLTLSADTTVTATFKQTPTTNMLSVVLSGAGTVTSTPSGINCGPTCTASFDTGTQITLSAAAAGGSTFAGWSGGGCSGIDGCALTLSADTTVTASFVANTAGNLTLVAAVLPTSRSVAVGVTATAFATMIDAGPADAVTCTIAPAISIPASFVFQTTDPTTNALAGTANTPVNITAAQAQSFVIGLTPTAAFSPANVAFAFTCANAPGPAATTVGIDTLNLSASTTPVPDIVALAASGDAGYIDITGVTETGAFAVATINLGVDATITASANTGTANLPVTLAVCQTNPTSGACMAAPAASVTTDIPPDATPTFGIFVTGSAAVADMPGVNRIFVTFTDSSGVLRGETSVAVRTQ